MGLFSRMKDGIKGKANAAIDKAIDPEKEIDMAILELEEQRRKALEELISFKASAKSMEQQIVKQEERIAEWEKRAMTAVRAGDDEAAKQALREKKNCAVEIAKIRKDRDEAAGYAAQLNKSRKEFETKLQLLKLRKGTLATQIASARAGGDAFGNDSSVWDKLKEAEERIDSEVIASEVDAAMRGEDAGAEFDLKLAAATGSAGQLPTGGDDALEKLKTRMAEEKAAKQRALGAGEGDKPKAGS